MKIIMDSKNNFPLPFPTSMFWVSFGTHMKDSDFYMDAEAAVNACFCDAVEKLTYIMRRRKITIGEVYPFDYMNCYIRQFSPSQIASEPLCHVATWRIGNIHRFLRAQNKSLLEILDYPELFKQCLVRMD